METNKNINEEEIEIVSTEEFEQSIGEYFEKRSKEVKAMFDLEIKKLRKQGLHL